MKKTKPILLILSSLLLAASVGAQTFTGANVGTPALPGSVTGTAPGVQTVVGGGNDIWGGSDNFYYVYASITGQVWDAKVKVQDLQGPDWWTKCELMARVPGAATPQGPDAFIAVMATRTAGENRTGPQIRTVRGGGADQVFWTDNDPAYPNEWLRLTRNGSVFSLYRSTDGATWLKFGDLDTAKSDVAGSDGGTRFGTPFPDPLFVGVAVTAHNDGDPTGGVATISDLSVTVTPSTPSLAILTNPQDTSTYVGCDAFLSCLATNTALANSPVGSYQWYKNGVAIPNAVNSQYAFLAGASDNGAKIYCQAMMAGAASLNSSTSTVTVLAAVEYPGYVKYQAWPGGNRTALNNGNYGTPGRVSGMPAFDAPYDWSGNFGARLSGLFTAPTTGDYVFFICADDDADLFLSTDVNPANNRLIAQQEGWSGRNNWISGGGGGNLAQRRSDGWTPDGGVTYPYASGIPLVAGQKYFIMATHSEGGGGDNVEAFFKLNTDPDPVDGNLSDLTNGVITMLTRPASTLTITTQPQDYSTFEGLDASFTVAATTDAEITPWYQWQRNQVDMGGRTGPTLAMSPANIADDGAKYRCIITLLPTSLSVTSAEVTLTVKASVFITGIVKREIWGPNGTVTRDDVNNGTAGAPTTKGFINGFDSVGGIGDNYAMRLSTWFVPATSGNYVFLVSSDDDSDLFISTDDDPINKRLIAQQTSWNGDREWSSATGQRSSETWSPDGGVTVPYAAGIPLVAGTRYYMEGTMHDGTGGDSLTAYYLLTGEAVPANGTVSNLRGARVGLKLPKPTSLTVTGPQSVTTHGWDQAVFSVAVTTDALYPPTYQWRRGAVNIAGATTSVYSLLTGTNDNGAVFSCVVDLSQYGVSNSATATLTVLGDAVYEGGVLREEFFQNVGWSDLLAGSFGAPSQVNAWTIFEAPVDAGGNFSRRVSGILTPAATGDYVFITSSDDENQFFLSTDDQPKNKRLICEQTSWNGSRAWISGGNAGQRNSSTFSPDGGTTFPGSTGYPLVAGTRYYIEGLMHEGGGGDNFAVTYKLYADPDPVDNDAPLLTGSVLGRMVAPPLPVLTAVLSGGNVIVSWAPAGGHLESSLSLGPGAVWNSEGAANPAILPATGTKFFKVVKP